MLRKLFTSYIQCIESIGAVGAVFEQVFFGLGEFLLQSSCSELKVHRLLSCGYRIALSESNGERTRCEMVSENSADADTHCVVIRELLTTNIQCVKSVSTICSMLQKRLFAFGQLLASLIFSETISAASDPGGLDCENEVIVVLSVEERHEALLSCEALVDEKVFLIVAHRVSDVDGFDLPAVTFKFVGDDPTEVLLVDGIVRAEGGSVVIKDHGLVAMLRIVAAEVVDECRYLTLELDIKGLDDIEPPSFWLSGYNPVAIGYNIVTI